MFQIKAITVWQHSFYSKDYNFYQPDKLERIAENELVFEMKDKYPVNYGPVLIIPKRHMASYFELTPQEVAAMHEVLQRGKGLLQEEAMEYRSNL